MARKVGKHYREFPPETLATLRSMKHLGTTAIWRRMKQKHIKPITPISEIRKMAARTARRYNTKVVISANPRYFSGERYMHSIKTNRFKAGSTTRNGIILHPVMQFTPQSRVQDLIDHEVDHLLAARRDAERDMKQGWRVIRTLKDGSEIWEKQ